MPKVTATLVDSGTIPERCDVMHFFLPTRPLLRINGVDNDRARLFDLQLDARPIDQTSFHRTGHSQQGARSTNLVILTESCDFHLQFLPLERTAVVQLAIGLRLTESRCRHSICGTAHPGVRFSSDD